MVSIVATTSDVGFTFNFLKSKLQFIYQSHVTYCLNYIMEKPKRIRELRTKESNLCHLKLPTLISDAIKSYSFYNYKMDGTFN